MVEYTSDIGQTLAKSYAKLLKFQYETPGYKCNMK